MRSPTQDELRAIQRALDEQTGGETCWEPDPEYIGVIDHYAPDGPGWTGKVAVFVGGWAECVNLVLFQADGSARIGTEEIMVLPREREPEPTLTAAEVAGVFWDYLKRSPGHPDRRLTAWGDKTKLGLVQTIKRLGAELRLDKASLDTLGGGDGS